MPRSFGQSAEAVAELCKVIGVPRLGQIGVSAEALHSGCPDVAGCG